MARRRSRRTPIPKKTAKRVVKPRPISLKKRLERATKRLKAGNYSGAETDAREILNSEPDHLEGLKLLSVALSRQENPPRDEILKLCQRAVDASPEDLESLHNLAKAYRLNRNNKAAFKIFLDRVKLDPTNDKLHQDAGRFLRDIGQFDEAIRAYDHALKHNPESTDALRELAGIYQSRGDRPKAIELYQRALSIAPENAVLHNNLGALYSDIGQSKLSIASFKSAVRCAPDNPIYYSNLGNNQYKIGQIAESAASYQKAFDLDKQYHFALAQGLHAYRQLCDWGPFKKSLRVLKKLSVRHELQKVSPFVLLSQPEIAAYDTKYAASNYCRSVYAKELRAPRLINTVDMEQRHHGKIRIGYLSADFHEHATSYLMVGVLEHHDQEHFETYAYSYGPRDRSAMQARVKKSI